MLAKLSENNPPRPLTALESLKAWNRELEHKKTWENIEDIKRQLHDLQGELDQIGKWLEEEGEGEADTDDPDVIVIDIKEN